MGRENTGISLPFSTIWKKKIWAPLMLRLVKSWWRSLSDDD